MPSLRRSGLMLASSSTRRLVRMRSATSLMTSFTFTEAPPAFLMAREPLLLGLKSSSKIAIVMGDISALSALNLKVSFHAGLRLFSNTLLYRHLEVRSRVFPLPVMCPAGLATTAYGSEVENLSQRTRSRPSTMVTMSTPLTLPASSMWRCTRRLSGSRMGIFTPAGHSISGRMTCLMMSDLANTKPGMLAMSIAGSRGESLSLTLASRTGMLARWHDTAAKRGTTGRSGPRRTRTVPW
mmetsp:Transcript_4171/g.13222  ORF Transcript_4171/g.13222 Transcript_4171/m.13222 type:complete len:239 (+) Transcript_4171:1076-1792(+)